MLNYRGFTLNSTVKDLMKNIDAKDGHFSLLFSKKTAQTGIKDGNLISEDEIISIGG